MAGKRRRRPRPELFVLVYGACLTLAAVTAAGLAALVGGHVESVGVQAAIAADRAATASSLARFLRPDDIQAGTDPVRRAELARELEAWRSELGAAGIGLYVAAGPMVEVGSPPPRDPALVAGALEGVGAARHEASVLVEYLPVQGGAGAAAVVVLRDTSPILAAADAVRRDVLLVVGTATLGLALLLFLIFRAAQVRIARQAQELVTASERDSLTGLANHGTSVAELAACLERARHTGGWVCLALIDVDSFGLLNDAYGFETGDRVLQQLASIARAEAPEDAIVGRFGADELILIGPPSCAHEIRGAVDRLRSRVAGIAIRSASGDQVPVTVSVGISSYPEHAGAVTELLSAATVTLGRAKASGGDAVELDAPDIETAAGQRSFDVLRGLVLAIDTKDRYTKRHSEDVARWALLLGRELALHDEACRAIQLAGLLHDVGKIGIPETCCASRPC